MGFNFDLFATITDGQRTILLLIALALVLQLLIVAFGDWLLKLIQRLIFNFSLIMNVQSNDNLALIDLLTTRLGETAADADLNPLFRANIDRLAAMIQELNAKLIPLTPSTQLTVTNQRQASLTRSTTVAATEQRVATVATNRPQTANSTRSRPTQALRG